MFFLLTNSNLHTPTLERMSSVEAGLQDPSTKDSFLFNGQESIFLVDVHAQIIKQRTSKVFFFYCFLGDKGSLPLFHRLQSDKSMKEITDHYYQEETMS